MANNRSYTRPICIAIVALLLCIVALPTSKKQWAPGFLRDASLHFGLDLAGGTQLDFRISERELDEQVVALTEQLALQKSNGSSAEDIAITQVQLRTVKDQKVRIVEAIRTVLERRINALGVSEAVITPSYIGDEKHLLVECPGVVDVQECINTVGKTINLEFKEEWTEASEEYEKDVRDQANRAYARITQSGETLALVGEDLSNELGVAFNPDGRFFKDQLPDEMQSLFNLKATDGVRKLDATIEVPAQQSDGSVVAEEARGIFLVEALSPLTETGRTIQDPTRAFEVVAAADTAVHFSEHNDVQLTNRVPTDVTEELGKMGQGGLSAIGTGSTARVLHMRSYAAPVQKMSASHILIAYAGASGVDESVTRTKEEALAFAQDLKGQLDGGSSFAELARTHSDGPSASQAGSLGEFGRGDMVAPFEQAAFTLGKNEVSDPVETRFGYHLIRSDSPATSGTPVASYDELIISGEGAVEKAESLKNQVQEGKVTTVEQQANLQTLFFSLRPTGWKDTSLDGKYFQAATVTLDPYSNLPIVQISFNQEGGDLFAELTKHNVNKRIAIFVGGQLVSAPVVQTEITGGTAVITGTRNLDEAKNLATDLNTGAIPAPIYLTGQRTVEATLGAEALRTSMQAAMIGILILMAYMIIVYRLLGLLADFALSVYALLFFALLKMPLFLFSDQYIVLTLAGMAGIILSIGMAVDANVLIFERIKEELRKGKALSTAARTGFERAWPSIRDGNVSTFITCSILFLIGTSIVRGFAVTLGIGVLISMFTAIVVTRWLIGQIAKSPLAERVEFFGVKRIDVHEE